MNLPPLSPLLSTLLTQKGGNALWNLLGFRMIKNEEATTLQIKHPPRPRSWPSSTHNTKKVNRAIKDMRSSFQSAISLPLDREEIQNEKAVGSLDLEDTYQLHIFSMFPREGNSIQRTKIADKLLYP